MTLPHGLYEQLLTESLARRLAATAHDDIVLDAVDGEYATDLLIDELSRSLESLLRELPGAAAERVQAQLGMVNALLVDLRTRGAGSQAPADPIVPPLRRLRAVRSIGGTAPPLPATGLVQPWLFTAAKASPTLFSELRHEAQDCDQIDILVSFITTSGVRKLIDVLQAATAPGALGVGRTTIRVLTTTYMGATEIDALNSLARLAGCAVKISLDGRRTRLHAKAWIFRRRSGFGAAYVGSANLSAAALLGGLEWTVKFTERGQETLYARAKAHFDTLWEDDEFQSYDPNDPASVAALRAALDLESGTSARTPFTFFDITPKRYQQEMLDQLLFERAHGRSRNLVVAATGTGKTVVAALDYRRTVEDMGGARPRLLFVAHREQILRQALQTYRHVLRDHSFGELLVGGATPSQHEHLFASIDSIVSRDLVNRFGSDYWHTVVVDECHRLAAPRLDSFARAIEPAVLLGLTATPERSDGQPLAPYFTSRPDGSPAAELRLWHALDLQLLTPFEYFGCDDSTDFSDVPWNKPGEREAIDRVVTGDQIRARMIVHEWERLSGSAKRSKAIVFCVSVAHARFMTDQFIAAGLDAVCVTGETSDVERQRAPQLLSQGKICAIVTVDLYNEGVDIPDVDTLLFLRPTQSPVLFQQQLGRGLRLSRGKSACLVLDFVGQHRSDFRFDRLLSCITGLSRRELVDAVQSDFSTLPSGCHIHLQRKTRQQVLASLQSLVNQSWRRLKTEVQAYAVLKGRHDFSLSEFLHNQQIDLREIYRESKPSGWTALRRDAALLDTGAGSDLEYRLSASIGRLLHVNDPQQIDLMHRVAERGATYRPSSDREALRAQMLTYQMETSAPQSYNDYFTKLASERYCLEELGEVAKILESRSRVGTEPISGLDDLPLILHARYRSEEVLTAAGWRTSTKRPPFQAGVLTLKDRQTELLFVTLDKSSGYHDRISYHDYAISPTHFHWQTQNSAAPDTPGGKRYLESQTNGWRFQLFVRQTKADAYVACGPVGITSPSDVSGTRPMSIRWTLHKALPLALFGEFSVLRAG